MRARHWLIWGVSLALAAVDRGEAVDIESALEKLRAVGPNGAGHGEAMRAWEQLVRADAAQLPAILAGMKGAGPLATNWIATAVDAIAERQLRRGGPLPAGALQEFLHQTGHAPRARRLAYEWLVRVDPRTPERLLPGMLHDSSMEIRRDAVARLIDQAAAAAKAEKRAEAVTLYRQAIAAARDLDQVRLLAERLRKLGQPVDLARQLGYVVRWKLIGPFDNIGDKGFDAVYGPEREIPVDAAYQGKKETVRWMDFTAADDLGTVDFNKALGEQKGVVGYALSEFVSPARQEVQLRLTSMNAVKLWLNGKPVNQYHVYHSGSQPDQYVNQVALEPGRNQILVKVCQNELKEDWARQWDFQLRVCDADGGAILPQEIRNPKSETRNKSQ
jgi:hypothetical protein